MRCLHCDYSLWNLRARKCPECGSPFSPRAYEFMPSSVRFCCPHCEQPYYGTSPTGLLEPDEFDCVQCGRHITLDDMVLLPAEGVTDQQTKLASNPWLERDRTGRFKAWIATISLALVQPNRLAQGTPKTSSLRQAWWFAIVTCVVTFGVSIIPAMCMVLVLPMLMPQTQQGGPTAGVLAGIMAGGVVFGIVAGFVFVLAYAGFWGLTTHLLLRVSGSDHGPLRVTMLSILYSSGTIVLSVIPCIGNMALVWWIVSAILMVKESHNVSGVRATFTVLTGPVVALVLLVAGYMVIIAVALTGMSATAMTVAPQLRTQSAQTVLEGLVAYAAVNGDRGPDHALELVLDTGLSEDQFIDPYTATATPDVPVVPGIDLLDLSLMSPDERPAVIDRAAAALPADVVAHRVGDFVFTYHGAVLDGGQPALWLVVMTPDPDTNQLPGLETPIVAGRADGTLLQILPDRFPLWLQWQNQLRAGQGLPSLPDPRTVTHRAPAVAAPEDRYDP